MTLRCIELDVSARVVIFKLLIDTADVLHLGQLFLPVVLIGIDRGDQEIRLHQVPAHYWVTTEDHCSPPQRQLPLHGAN